MVIFRLFRNLEVYRLVKEDGFMMKYDVQRMMRSFRDQRYGFSQHLLALIVLCFATLSVEDLSANASYPNVIVIFVDDLGYGDLSCYGSKTISTPNLDKMAEEGVRFTDFYSANSVCSPSRASLLTGRYPSRTGLVEVLFPMSRKGLNQDELTIAELFKTKNYATACIGKWHLGHREEYLPMKHGFDRYYGIPYSNDMYITSELKLSDELVLSGNATLEKIKSNHYNWKLNKSIRRPTATDSVKAFPVPLMRNDEVIEFPVDQSQITRRYTDEAIDFIGKNTSKPFFIYLSHSMPHVPVVDGMSPRFRDSSEHGPYGDVVQELDHEVGRLLNYLDEHDLSKNTLVVFTSDNGPWDIERVGGSSGPLKGSKFLSHEGGQRVPMIARQKGWIPPGKTVTEVASTIDFLPTFAQMIDVVLPEDRVVDGVDISDLLQVKPNARSERDCFYFVRGWEVHGVRQGPWKLQTAIGGHKYKNKRVEGIPGHLYHLRNDISESKNLAEEYPEIFDKLMEKIKKFENEVEKDKQKFDTYYRMKKDNIKIVK